MLDSNGMARKNDNNTDIALIYQSIEYIEERLHNFVTKDEFALVRGIVFGLVSLILVTVVGAMLSQIIKR